MALRAAFIGHRNIPFHRKVEKRLQAAIDVLIDMGIDTFTMGTHGDFDQMALSACRQAREQHPEINIEVVLTSYSPLMRKDEWDYVPYQDVSTVMYDIEDVHFKQRIIVSNKKMVDQSVILVTYIDPKSRSSGAKRIRNYARRNMVEILDLFNDKDDPYYGMTPSQRLKAYHRDLLAYIGKDHLMESIRKQKEALSKEKEEV